MISNQPRIVILLLCHKATESLIQMYKSIREASQMTADLFILYHLKDANSPQQIGDLGHFYFTDTVITQLNYIPIGFNLIPGNNHFPLLKFHLENPHYDYYWCIEDDVRFNGNWKYFFDSFSSVNDDFLTSHIRVSSEEPEWPWWSALSHPYTIIDFEKRIRSFNPVYRISKTAINFIHNALVNCWSGHHEVLFPTLLHRNGYNIGDIGGVGKFVLPGFYNRFYVDSTPNRQGNLSDGTMRFRPLFSSLGTLPNKLYHPIKK